MKPQINFESTAVAVAVAEAIVNLVTAFQQEDEDLTVISIADVPACDDWDNHVLIYVESVRRFRWILIDSFTGAILERNLYGLGMG
jgi:hypothetical protein